LTEKLFVPAGCTGVLPEPEVSEVRRLLKSVIVAVAVVVPVPTTVPVAEVQLAVLRVLSVPVNVVVLGTVTTLITGATAPQLALPEMVRALPGVIPAVELTVHVCVVAIVEVLTEEEVKVGATGKLIAT
jgi:hypothetical protein